MLNKTSKMLLKELCTNARIKLPALSKKFGMSRYLLAQEIKNLEKELELHYTLELDNAKLGFGTTHIMHLKFVKRPSSETLERILNKIPPIQLALLTKGDFDLLCFAVTRTPVEYSQIEIALQLLLEEYGAKVKSAEVTLARLGFVPLDSNLISRSALESEYKEVLIRLNANSHAKISEISRSIGISDDLVRYYIAKMEREGIIKRYTAVIGKPNTGFTIAYLANYAVRENLQSRIDKERREIIFTGDEQSDVNDFQFMFSTTGSEQTLNIATYRNRKYGLEHSVKAHNRIYAADRPEVVSAEITKPVKGAVPFRYLNVKEVYDISNWPLEFS
ncbi:MAG: winged helix-turn-helix transcriptional regulator [Candidatus Micrarchaeota archaeon]|nr:winged helix-turn-helix transcriptional regulator [Candidatus Micrarchaeota archaeon]